MLWYDQFVKSCVQLLRSYKYYNIATVVGTLLSEFIPTLRTALYFHKGKKEHFHYFGMNPSQVDPESKPILMIHGNFHNQSAWLELAKDLKENGLGPLFTLNVSYKDPFEENKKLLEEKMSFIKSLYPKDPPKIDIVGHSRGCLLAMVIAMDGVPTRLDRGGRIAMKEGAKWRKDVGQLIRLGNPLCQREREWMPEEIKKKMFEIDGSKDLIVHDYSSAGEKHRFTAKCGHLGLLYSQEVHQKIIELLR